MYLIYIIKRILRCLFRKVFFLAVLIMLALYLFSGCSQNDNRDPGSETAPTFPQTEIQGETIVQGNDFVKLDFGFGEQTMEGKTGYKQIEDKRQYSLDWKEILQLEPTETVYGPTGHKIYKGKDGEQYILSDDVPVWIGPGNKLDMSLLNCILREEGTGKQIRTFITQSEVDMFNKGYEEGQAILRGEKKSKPQGIIYDGVLTPFTFEGEANADAVIDLRDIALWSSPDFYCYENDAPEIIVVVNENYAAGFKTMLLRESSYDRLDVNVVDNSYRFRAYGVEFRTQLVHPDKPQLTVKEIARMLGWTVYSDGQCLSILTDESNITDKAIVYNSNSVKLETVIERDNEDKLVSRQYDRFHNLISESPYEGEDDEYMQSIVPKKNK